ncbi:hypothetical protein BG845_06041 [Pseudonocardia autotrophica]|uniref:Uncharacterized protein n=1 Tax=Pseudonocardia autotrophica TaxID=2074 RepID=A0A1Y2MJR5_PSEAH|nr:hypothetical protein BG845_06041 [Pseudonocardia autotrophica]
MYWENTVNASCRRLCADSVSLVCHNLVAACSKSFVTRSKAAHCSSVTSRSSAAYLRITPVSTRIVSG